MEFNLTAIAIDPRLLKMWELLPVVALGFLGSFGHCAGMCGPLVVAFSVTDARRSDELVNEGLNELIADRAEAASQSLLSNPRSPHWSFQLWLNFGRLLGYGLVGGVLGGLGEATIAGGQLFGVGSGLRQAVAIVTGLLLIGFGLQQVSPGLLPSMPRLWRFNGWLHGRLSRWMSHVGDQRSRPVGGSVLLGCLWGLMPCGFLFAAQLRAIGTGSVLLGLLTMLAFGLGTLPVMLGIGWSASWLGADRRSQLFRAAGAVAIAIGVLTLLRTDAMFDWTGHAALLLLSWALVARPLAHWWPLPLHYRRAIGVAAFVLALGHVGYQADHSLNWNPDTIRFMVPSHRYGLLAGIAAIVCMIPAALTSFDRLQSALGQTWRRLHLLSVPALILASGHTIFSGSHYLGELAREVGHYGRALIVFGGVILVLGLRSGGFGVNFGRSPNRDATPSIAPTTNPETTDCCRDR